MKQFLQTTAAVFVGATTSLLSINGMTAALHSRQAYQWSQTCDFRPVALMHAEKAAELNPLYGQVVTDVLMTKSC